MTRNDDIGVMKMEIFANEYLVQHKVKAIFLNIFERGYCRSFLEGNGRLATDRTHFKNSDTSLSVREENTKSGMRGKMVD